MNTHGRKLEVFCQREPLWQSVRFWIKETSWSPDSIIISYALPFTMQRTKPENEGMEMPSAFQMGDEQAQQFMDSLWSCGFRPTEGSGSAGSLAATQAHLQDMRALVFKEAMPEKKS